LPQFLRKNRQFATYKLVIAEFLPSDEPFLQLETVFLSTRGVNFSINLHLLKKMVVSLQPISRKDYPENQY